MSRYKSSAAKKAHLCLFLFSALTVSACNTVDKTAYANASCGELKALAESFDAQASQHMALLNDTTEFSRRNQKQNTQERLLNTRKSNPFKQKSAIRSAYKKNGC